MKYAKMLGLLAVAAAALMAFAGSASATTLTITNPPGTKVVAPAHTPIVAHAVGETILDGTVNIKCKKSLVEGETENEGSSSTTVKGPLSKLTFEECGANTVTVVNKGSLEIHTDSATADGNGTLTSTGAEVTVLTHNILGTVHCIYITNETDVGTLDGSTKTGGTATLTVDSVPIPRASTDFGCGSTSEWTAHYTITSPDWLDVD